MKILPILLTCCLTLSPALLFAGEDDAPAKKADAPAKKEAPAKPPSKKAKAPGKKKAQPGKAEDKKPSKKKPADPQPTKPEAPESAAEASEPAPPDAEQQELARIEQEIKKLSLQKSYYEAREALAKAEIKQRFLKEHLELEEQAARFNLKKNRLELDLAESKLEIQKLSGELELMAKRREHETAKRNQKLERELAELAEKKKRVAARNDLRDAEMAAELNELKLRDAKAKSDKMKMDVELARIEFDARRRSSEDKAEQSVDRTAITYTQKPHQDRTLIVSDRRIELNGVIDTRSADRVVERINYFNNKNAEYPIFIVIDSNPGGSVMAGYRILKAMEGSQAPVYTVVKSYAASMAATIATLSEKSFAYPNAVILHHQISSMTYGNLTQQTEHVEEMNEWWRRLAEPIAKKMGIGLDEFITRMYKNDSSGDWNEFADQARELKWVDHIVDEIRETSLIKNPDARSSTPPSVVLPIRRTEAEAAPAGPVQVDAQGREYYKLPKLEPFDYWFLYNPNGYYRP